MARDIHTLYSPIPLLHALASHHRQTNTTQEKAAEKANEARKQEGEEERPADEPGRRTIVKTRTIRDKDGTTRKVTTRKSVIVGESDTEQIKKMKYVVVRQLHCFPFCCHFT